MAKRVGSPLGVAVVAAVLAGLVTALVLSFTLDDGGDDATGGGGPPLTLAEAPEEAPQVDLAGTPAPEFRFESLADGEEVDYAELRAGRPAVVNFFGAWCTPCVQEMPDFQEAFESWGDRVAFLGLSTNESPEDGQELVERTGVTYDTGRDPDGSIVTSFAAVNMPTTIFIRADGTILRSHTGRLYPDELEAALEELVA